MSNYCKVWGIMRVVDGELCFLDRDGCFGPLSDHSEMHVSRNDAFTAAQSVRGLLCQITKELALGYALTSSTWEHNQAVATA